jgi:hypothetical protein
MISNKIGTMKVMVPKGRLASQNGGMFLKPKAGPPKAQMGASSQSNFF